VVICLERGADLHMAQLMPLPLTVPCFSKSRLVLPFWYRPTWVVPEKGPLNGCVYVSFWEHIKIASRIVSYRLVSCPLLLILCFCWDVLSAKFQLLCVICNFDSLYLLWTIHREDYSPGIESFDQFSQIAFNNADKARVTSLYHHRSIW